jgi:hypothetical protein
MQSFQMFIILLACWKMWLGIYIASLTLNPPGAPTLFAFNWRVRSIFPNRRAIIVPTSTENTPFSNFM